jgi:Holliday junction resolvasome RuvABC DNA-binding subunit
MMTDQDKNQQADESKQQKEDQLRAAAKPLKATGFSNEQIAQQLSAKHQMAAADIEAVLDQDKEDDK